MTAPNCDCPEGWQSWCVLKSCNRRAIDQRDMRLAEMKPEPWDKVRQRAIAALSGATDGK